MIPWLLGCRPDPHPEPTDEPAAHTADDTGGHSGAPTSVSVACGPTDNALRFRCVVDVDPPSPVTLTWARDDGLGAREVHSPSAARHDLGVGFLAAQTLVRVTAAAGGGVARTTLTAGSPPSAVGSQLVTTSGAPTVAYLGAANGCARDAHVVVYEVATGEVVWYQDLAPGDALGVLDMARFGPGEVAGEVHDHLVRVDFEGRDLARVQVDYPGGGLHHDLSLVDGLFVAPFQEIVGDLTLDPIVGIDAAGAEAFRWHPADHLPIPADAEGDYLHTNTVSVGDDGDLYVSWMHRASVGRVAAEPGGGFGAVRWVLSGDGVGALGDDIALDWTQVDGADGFEVQHDLFRRRDGRLQLLDNAHGRSLVIALDEGAGAGVVEGAYRTREPECGAQGTSKETASGNVVTGCFGPYVGEYDVVSGDRIWEGELRCSDGGRGRVVRWYPL